MNTHLEPGVTTTTTTTNVQETIVPGGAVITNTNVTPTVIKQDLIEQVLPVIKQEEVIYKEQVIKEEELIREKPVIKEKEIIREIPVIHEQTVIVEQPVIREQPIKIEQPVILEKKIIANPVYEKETKIVVEATQITHDQQIIKEAPRYVQEKPVLVSTSGALASVLERLPVLTTTQPVATTTTTTTTTSHVASDLASDTSSLDAPINIAYQQVSHHDSHIASSKHISNEEWVPPSGMTKTDLSHYTKQTFLDRERIDRMLVFERVKSIFLDIGYTVPPRSVVDNLFMYYDSNNEGFIGERRFYKLLKILFGLTANQQFRSFFGSKSLPTKVPHSTTHSQPIH
jgi:hypothetical protein